MSARDRSYYPISRYPILLESRSDGSEGRTLHGMAPPYNEWSPQRGDMKERILSGAFEGSNEDAIATWEHTDSLLLGRESAGSLRFDERDDGSHWFVDLGTRSYELDLAQSIDRKEITGSSFEFVTMDSREWQEWEPVEEDGQVVWMRTVKRAIRYQVGPVARPWYDNSSADFRSLDTFKRAAKSAGISLPSTVTVATPPAEYYERRQQLLQRRLDIGRR